MQFDIMSYGLKPRITLPKAYGALLKAAPYLVALLLVAGSAMMWLRANYQGGDKLAPILIHLLVSEAMYVTLALLAIGGLKAHVEAFRTESRYPASRVLSSALALAGGALALVALFCAFSNALAYLLSFGDQIGTVDPLTMELTVTGLSPDILAANAGGFFPVIEYAQMALLGLGLALAPEGSGSLAMALINLASGLAASCALYILFRFLSERAAATADIAEGSGRS